MSFIFFFCLWKLHLVVKRLFCVIGYIGEEVTAFCARSTSTSKCALGTVYACDRQVLTQFLAFYLKIISCDGVVIYAHMDTHKEVRKKYRCPALSLSAHFPWDRRSWWSQHSPFWLGWVANKPQQSSGICLSNTHTHTHTWLFAWVLGLKLRSLHSHSKNFCPLCHLPSSWKQFPIYGKRRPKVIYRIFE